MNLYSFLKDEKSCENVLVYNILYKNFIAKHLRIRFDKIDGFIRFYNGTRSLHYYLEVKNMIPLTTGLDIV